MANCQNQPFFWRFAKKILYFIFFLLYNCIKERSKKWKIIKNYTNINVKYLREKKGISQTKLAKELNIDTSTLAKWENNTRQITLEWAIKLANYFDMNVGDFISVNQITNTSYPTQNNAEYKKILKEKGLMDDEENINDESLNKLLKIADMIDGINKKEN